MLWNGFSSEEFEFEGFKSVVVFPEKHIKKPTLIIKTEYWGAFPETEIELLKQGYYLAFITNANRWGTDDDLNRKARFVKYVINKYNLNEKCVPLGMSCGGLIAVKFAAKFPDLVACIYIDAPVINYMSCPCGFGIGVRSDDENFSEILGALNLDSISQLICYRDMPQDRIPDLINNRIPVVMVAGDSDIIVPYIENGILIENAYKQTDIDIEIHIKEGCNHHPHGLDDPTPVIEFISKHLY